MMSTATAAVKASFASPVIASQPASVARDRTMTIGTKIAGHAVGESLDGSLACLRVGDEPRDLSQCRVGADPGRPHDQPAGGVERAAGDLRARDHLRGHRLAREHRLIDGREALGDDAVRRDLLARADDEDVADA